MKKFLNVIAFAILAVGLVIGGIMCLVNYGHFTGDVLNQSSVETVGTYLGLGIGMLAGGVASAIASIASFFTTKTK